MVNILVFCFIDCHSCVLIIMIILN